MPLSRDDASPRRFDFDAIAESYDAHRRVGGPFVSELVRLAETCGARRALELGCGTGNSAAGFLGAYACELTGLDRSPSMLAQARGKSLSASWLCADATHLPFRDAAFDFIFSVLMLHHVDDLAALFAECRRVLAHGATAFVTAPHDFIGRHPLAAYFPSFATIDRERFQPEPVVERALRDAGFTDVSTVITKRKPEPIDAAYLARIEAKFITTLKLIPEDEFEIGIARLRDEVAAKGQLDEPIVWEAAIISGHTS